MVASHSKEPVKPVAKARTRLKPKRKPKRKVIPKRIRETCLSAMQKLRRLEEANDEGYVSCISCGRVMHWKEAQGGHYISRTCRATELEKDNIWPQCPRCNGPLCGNPVPYRYNLVKRIGEARVKRLEDMREAYYGNQEAFDSLSREDQKAVLMKRGKVYYAETLESIKPEIERAEDGKA